jgi:hypothetical protein
LKKHNIGPRSVKYESQNTEDKLWTPHSKEFFGWQTNNNRGDTLVVNYATSDPNTSRYLIFLIRGASAARR